MLGHNAPCRHGTLPSLVRSNSAIVPSSPAPAVSPAQAHTLAELSSHAGKQLSVRGKLLMAAVDNVTGGNVLADSMPNLSQQHPFSADVKMVSGRHQV